MADLKTDLYMTIVWFNIIPRSLAPIIAHRERIGQFVRVYALSAWTPLHTLFQQSPGAINSNLH